MRAQVGDWLIVRGRDNHEHHGLVLEVHGDGGEPPFQVRWADDGHEALVFPGGDAVVLSQAEFAEHNAMAANRALRVQSEIVRSAHRPAV